MLEIIYKIIASLLIIIVFAIVGLVVGIELNSKIAMWITAIPFYLAMHYILDYR